MILLGLCDPRESQQKAFLAADLTSAATAAALHGSIFLSYIPNTLFLHGHQGLHSISISIEIKFHSCGITPHIASLALQSSVKS